MRDINESKLITPISLTQDDINFEIKVSFFSFVKKAKFSVLFPVSVHKGVKYPYGDCNYRLQIDYGSFDCSFEDLNNVEKGPGVLSRWVGFIQAKLEV
jgi:hypothetical protein